MSQHTHGDLLSLDPLNDLCAAGSDVVVSAFGVSEGMPAYSTIARFLPTEQVDDDGREWKCGGSAEANARLFLAAHDLLEACKLAKAFGSQGETHDGLSVSTFLEKAIAKAETRNL